jgi:tetratricopeptide (TPR) repeat protein
MCLSNLAILKQATGRHAQAESLFQKALRLLQRALGDAHYLTAFTRSNFADFLLLRGRVAEALLLAKRSVADLRNTLPKGHYYVQWARQVLARSRKLQENQP